MSPRYLVRPWLSAAFALLGTGPLAEATVPVTLHNQTARTLAVIRSCPGHGAPAGLRPEAGAACGCLEPGMAEGSCPGPRPGTAASDCCCLRPGASATYQLDLPKETVPSRMTRLLPEGGVIHYQCLTIVAVDPVPPCPCSMPESEPAAHQLVGDGPTLRILDPASLLMPGPILPGPGTSGPGIRPIGDEPPPDPEGSGTHPEPDNLAGVWCG